MDSTSAPSRNLPQKPRDPKVRSCIACYKRKVRCDRRSPCSKCLRSHTDCVYPTKPESASLNLGEDEIASRMQKLEGVVADLRNRLPQRRTRRLSQPHSQLLMTEDEDVNYLHNAFWKTVNVQLEKAVDLLTLPPDAPPVPSPASVDSSENFLFGYGGSNVDLQPLHPSPSQILFLWRIFKERVDPATKMFHMPTLIETMDTAFRDLANLQPSTEVTIFLIYYSSITSMEPLEVEQNLGVSRAALLKRFRFGLEQAFAKAQFLTSRDLSVFRSFVCFLVLLRKNGDFKVSSSMVGLAVRISQSLGLHRDGTQLQNLTPFKIEMRRRAFWCLVVLDHRASEDMGMDPMLIEGTYDTQVPTNVDDSDISPHMKELPGSKTRITEMTMSLIRIDTLVASMNVNKLITEGLEDNRDGLDAKCDEIWLQTYEDIRNKYLLKSAQDERYWLLDNMSRIVIAKLRLMARCAMPDREDAHPLERLVSTTEIIEYNHMANSDERAAKWRWIFVAYTRWHGATYLLTEMLRREWSPIIERAWEALNDILRDSCLRELESARDGTVMKIPFQKLYALAAKHREAEFARLREDETAAKALLGEAELKSDLTFIYVPSRGVAHGATDRWRAAVGLAQDSAMADQRQLDGWKGFDISQSSWMENMEEWNWPLTDSTVDGSPADGIAPVVDMDFALGNLF